MHLQQDKTTHSRDVTIAELTAAVMWSPHAG